MKTKQGVFVIPIYDKKIIIFKRSEDWVGWEFIKGGVHEGESSVDAAKRELLEEFNIDSDNLVKLNKQFIFIAKKPEGDIKVINDVFVTEISDEMLANAKLNEEHSEYKVVDIDEAIRLLPFSDLKEFVDNEIKKIISRTNLKKNDKSHKKQLKK